MRPVARIPELPDGLPGSCRSRACLLLIRWIGVQACDKIGIILNRLSESDNLSVFLTSCHKNHTVAREKEE